MYDYCNKIFHKLFWCEDLLQKRYQNPTVQVITDMFHKFTFLKVSFM